MTARANALVRACMDYLAASGVYAWRQNNAPVPVRRGGDVVAFRRVETKGVPDILGVLPRSGRFLGVECKTGSGRLSPEQEEFRGRVEKCGGIYLAVWSVDELVAELAIELSMEARRG